MKKQSAAYALALILGATSVLGGVTLPSFEQDASVVQAASPSLVMARMNLSGTTAEEEVKTEDELRTALAKGGTITLGSDITIEGNERVTLTAPVIFDLNNHTLTNKHFLFHNINQDFTIKGEGTFDSPIELSNSSTQINLKILSGTGTISSMIHLGKNVNADIAGGTIGSVYIDDGSTLSMSDGKVGIAYVHNGTFNMSGGEINSNDSYGIFIESNGKCTMTDGKVVNSYRGIAIDGSGVFEMKGGEISDNKATGVDMGYTEYGNGIFNMSGGKITGNGRGVEISGKNEQFTMTSGSISDNNGIGVTISDGTFTMSNGNINNNTGGGVNVDGAFNMSGGSINNNGDTGVYANSETGIFTLSGGSITNNHSRNSDRTHGGGVYIYDTTFNLSGSPVITGNKNADNETENVRLSGTNAKITINGTLQDGCKVGIYSYNSGDFTKNYGTHNDTTDPTKYFSSDRSDYAVSLNATSGEAQLTKTSSSSSSSSSSNTTTRSTSSGTTTSRSTSSSSGTVRSSSSSSDDDDDDSSSKSFSEGGTKTGGSGSSKGDYKKAGKTSAKYTMTDVSDKATTAIVPATVKIGKKTYNVTAISSDAFIGYSNLKTVTIGKNIKKIGKSAFSGYSSLKTLTINSKKLTAKNIKGALKGSAVKTVYVPADKVQAYKKIFTKKITGSKNKITVKAIKS